MWDGELFVKKIEYIYKNICSSDDDEITNLFYESSSRYDSRKRLIRNHWRKRVYKKKPDLLTEVNFEKFGISKLKIENRRVFSLDSLLYEEFNLFQKRVDDYVNYVEQNTKASYDIPYRYIYYFDDNLKKILYYSIKLECYGTNEYNIILIPPTHYKNVENLTGSYLIQHNLIHIAVNNSFQTLTLSFSYNMGYNKGDTLYGIGLNKTAQRGVPRASKMLLSTTQLSNIKKAHLYLYANESESIEINYKENSNKEALYLFKYYRKLKLIYTFLKKSKRLFRERLSANIYLNIFFKEFKAFIFMYKKVVEKKKYFVENRKRATRLFLQSMIKRESSCYIVHPLFECESNFLANTEKAIASVDFNIKVANQGVKIYRIFVIESIDDIDDFALSTIKKMSKAKIDIKFVFKRDIENYVSSYDFAFPIEKDVVLHRERIKKSNNFSINPDQSTIVMYANNYRLIEERSLKIEEILELKNQKSYESYMPKENFLFSQDNRVLQKLLRDDGIWYFYSYPSNPNIKEKVWIVQTQFFENFTLIDAYRNKGQLFIGTHQSIAIKEGNNSKNMTAIVFDNSKISYGILPFARISKSNGAEEQMLTFGFFARREFSEEEAMEILGSIDKLQMKIDYKFVQRVLSPK